MQLCGRDRRLSPSLHGPQPRRRNAEKAILADEYFVPEVGRARACGARDAAESFQKVSRAMRLTLMLQRSTAEWVRDLRAGVRSCDAAARNAGASAQGAWPQPERRRPAASRSEDRARDCDDRDRDEPDSDAERLIDIERRESLPRAPFRETVDQIVADLGVAIDWSASTVSPAAPHSEASQPRPPDWGMTASRAVREPSPTPDNPESNRTEHNRPPPLPTNGSPAPSRPRATSPCRLE
jgi:hypothetical protein